MQGRGWKPEWLTILRQKRALGLSAGTIARQMSDELHARFTRNSIIGKLARERIPAPRQLAPVSRSGGRKRKEVTMPTPTPSPAPMTSPSTTPSPTPSPPLTLVPVPVPEAPALPCLLWELPAMACHWPVNESASWRQPHLFCGLPATRQVPPYCEQHYALSVAHSRPREPVIPTD